jgi:glycosyltransferase involved in cell wall biosynthesis
MYYEALGDSIGLVAISDAQRSKAPHLPWLATAANAIRVETFPFSSEKEEFALFLGRFHPDKAPHLAIEAARAVGLPIVLAGKCAEPIERAYFAREIESRLGDDVTIFGVANATQKRDLLVRARCLLFPACWDEPFGLVMIEAMACGTPVVGLRRGAVSEVVVDGLTGILADHPDELAGAVNSARAIDPHDCRRHVETRFTPEQMAASYEAAYRSAIRVALAGASAKSALAHDKIERHPLWDATAGRAQISTRRWETARR